MKRRTGLSVLLVVVAAACENVPLETRPEPVASVEVSGPGASVVAGRTLQLAALPRARNGEALSGRTVSWSSSDEAVATVSASGLLYAHAAGQAIIRASSEGKIGQLAVDVVRAPVTAVQITPSAMLVLDRGATLSLGVVARGEDGRELSGRETHWAVADTAIASITAGGVLQAKRAGSTAVTVRVETVTATAALMVRPLVASIDLGPQGAQLDIRQVLQLQAQPRGTDGIALNLPVTWTSSNPDVATVNASGRVTGAGAGTAVITASSEGVSAAVSVVVSPWTMLRLQSANDSALPTTVTVAERMDEETVLLPYQIQNGVLRLGPNGRYQLLFFGLMDGMPSYGVESVGQVFYHGLEGYLMLFPDGSDTSTGTPQFRSVSEPGALLVLRGPLQPGGPAVRLTFEQYW